MNSDSNEIVHVVTTIERGGAEHALLQLSVLQAAKQNVTVIPLKGDPQLLPELISEGVKVDTFLLKKNFLRQILVLRKKKFGAAVFHAHLPRAEFLLFLTKRRNRYIVTRHNSEKFAHFLPRALSSQLSRVVTRYARCVICISDAVVQHVVTHKELSNRTKIFRVYYGYKQRYSPEERKTLRSKKKSNISNLVCVSRLAKQKNLTLALTFMEAISKVDGNVRLDIFGEGPEKQHLIEFCNNRGIENVSFRGKVSNIHEHLTNYDLFLMTSTYEGFGLATLEAMDCGLAVLAPRNSAFPEVLGNSYPGLFEDNDLEDLIEKFEGIRKLGFDMLQTYQHLDARLAFFSTDKMLQEHERIYSATK